MAHVTWHITSMTKNSKDHPPAYSITMHSRPVHQDRTQKHEKTQNKKKWLKTLRKSSHIFAVLVITSLAKSLQPIQKIS